MNVAARIYAASTSEEEADGRLAEELARRIEDDIASRDLPPGGALGSLRELSERYAVGRSVAREAMGLLERRGLGRLRPGPRGGFVLAKPQPEVIAEALAEHFRAGGVAMRQLMDAREAVDLMAARLAAAARPAPAELGRLDKAYAAGGLTGRLAARAEIARLAGEPLLRLLVECLNSLTVHFGGVEAPPALDDRRQAAAMRRALVVGDVRMAADAALRSHHELGAWLVERPAALRPASATAARAPAGAGTLSALIARRLTAEIAAGGAAGTRLGSEWDLCERFNVSRLTLRQAIRLLQDSGLVECRRGRGNGLLVRDRRSAGAIRLMLAYLIGERLDPMTAGALLFQINCFVPALAVSRADAGQRRELEAALARVEGREFFDRFDLLGLVHCVSRAADSPIIDLFSRCLAAYEARFRPSLAERLPARAQASYFRLMRRLLEGPPLGAGGRVERAKAESAALMLEMSRSRPL